MKKVLMMALLLTLAIPFVSAEEQQEEKQKKEFNFSRFARKKTMFTMFYNTTSFSDFKHNSRYGVGLEWTGKHYVGLSVRQTMNFGLDTCWTGVQELNPNYDGKKHWNVSTEVGPNVSFFINDHIGIVIPFYFSFRYGGNASEFYQMKTRTIGNSSFQYALAYMMTPTLNLYLKKSMLSVGLDFEVVPTGYSKEEIKLNNKLKGCFANVGLHLGIGLGH